MLLDGKSSKKYLVNVLVNLVPLVSILGPALFLLYTNGLPDDLNCDITIYADDTTLFSK